MLNYRSDTECTIKQNQKIADIGTEIKKEGKPSNSMSNLVH